MSDSKKLKKAVILVAGFGTRFLPATKAQPKEMLPLVDKPIVQYLVEEAALAGLKEIVLVTGKNKRAIEDHFDRAPELEQFLESRGKSDLAKIVRDVSSLARVAYVRQKEQDRKSTRLNSSHSSISFLPLFLFFFFKRPGAHRYLPSSPTRRSSDLESRIWLK